MKNLKIIIFLAGLISSANSLAMEQKQVSRPVRTAGNVENLGAFGQVPDEIILSVALEILNQSDAKKAYQELVKLRLTNKYINQLIIAASTEKTFGDKVEKIKEEIMGFKKDLPKIKKFQEDTEKSGYVRPFDWGAAIDTGAVYWLKNMMPVYNQKLKKIIFDNLSSRYDKLYTNRSDDQKKIYLKMAKIIIDSGFNINDESVDFSEKPLYMALLNKHFDLAKLLLDNGAKINEDITSLADALPHVKNFIEDYQKNKSLSGKQEVKK